MKKNIGWKILIPIVLLLAILWYQLVYVATRDKINDLNLQQEEVEVNITFEQARNSQMRQMQSELDTLKNKEVVTEIAAFDNIQNVMNSLNQILAGAEDYNLTFDAPEQDEESGLYRRHVTMEFQTANFADSAKIIRQLYQSPYRCVIGTMGLRAEDSTGNNDGVLSIKDDKNTVNMEIVYYEIDVN